MPYPYEDHLIQKLYERTDISNAISDLEKKRKDINEQIKQWMKMNKIEEYTVTDPVHNDSWTLKLSKYPRQRVIDFNVLRNKLGNDASVFIQESEVETLRVNQRKK